MTRLNDMAKGGSEQVDQEGLTQSNRDFASSETEALLETGRFGTLEDFKQVTLSYDVSDQVRDLMMAHAAEQGLQ